MGDSIVELKLPLGDTEFVFNVDDGEEKKEIVLKLPIVYRKDGSESVFETMSIASVVEHDGKLYRLRMPNAKKYINKNIRVTVNNASEKDSKFSFDHEKDHTLNYRRVALEKSDTNEVPEKYLDPRYFTSDQSLLNAYNMVDEQDVGDISSSALSTGKTNRLDVKQFKNIALDCFAIELGGSSHYLICIAGQWFISFSNFFKFFSEDYRRRNINEIVKKIKEMKKSLCVKRDKVDDLLSEVYPIWSGFNDRRLDLIGRQRYYTIQDIKKIITNHMEGTGGTSPYPETQYGRGSDSFFEEKQKEFLKSVDKAFWKYASIHPHWSTKDQFDSFFSALSLDPGNYYRSLTTQVTIDKDDEIKEGDYSDISDSDDDKEEEKEDASVPPRQSGPIDPSQIAFNEITYTKIKELVGDTGKVYAHMQSYALELLKKLNIIEGDRKAIVSNFFGEKKFIDGNFDTQTDIDIQKDLSSEGFQKAMQTVANNEPGKFGLFAKLAELVGVEKADDKDLLKNLKEQLQQARQETERLGAFKQGLIPFLNRPNPGANPDDQDKAADQQQQPLHTPEEAARLMRETENNLQKMPKKIDALKREIHAMENTMWVKLRHVLERIGVKAINKAAGKKNAVFTLDEFDAMLDAFSGLESLEELTQRKEWLEAKLLKIGSDLPVVDPTVIRAKIRELEDEMDETYTNFGVPERDGRDYFPTGGFPNSKKNAVDPNDLDSSRLFRGNKGKKLDRFIQDWMNERGYGNGFKFFWSNKHHSSYGITSRSVKWNEDKTIGTDSMKDPRTVCINLPQARENPIIETYYTLLHELGHVRTPHKYVYPDPETWTHRPDGPAGQKWTEEEEWAAVYHDLRWKEKAWELFREFEEEEGIQTPREPKQYCTNVAWHKVTHVKRRKVDRLIVKVRYPGVRIALKKGERRDYEIVAYDKDDYNIEHYAWFDGDGLIRKRKERHEYLTESIRLLNDFIAELENPDQEGKTEFNTEQKRKINNLVGDSDIIDEREEIEEKLQEVEEKINQLKNRQASDYMEDPNLIIFVELAKYIRSKVRSSKNVEEMVKDICTLYSAKTGEKEFKQEMQTIIDNAKSTAKSNSEDSDDSEWVEGDSDWVNSSGDIRGVHNYIEAMVSIRYISDESDDDLLKARTNERFNGIAMALRYAMYLDGVPIDLLANTTFEKMSKFGEKVNKKEVTIDVMFPKKNTKQKGLYEPIMDWNPPTSTAELQEFHSKAEEVLAAEPPWRKMRTVDKSKTKKSKKPKRKTNTRSSIELYRELPNFLSMTLAAINANMRTQPQVIPRQAAAECGLHAVNNLLQSDYTLENFQKVQGTRQWFTDTTLGIILGNPGTLSVDGRRWVSANENRTLSVKYSMNYFERYADVFMDDENLVGFIFFLGPDSAGHWTSVKKWDTDGFTYMDSFKPAESGDGGLVVTLPKREMIPYIMIQTYRGRTPSAFFAVYKDTQTFNTARLNIERLDAGYGAQTSPAGSGPGGSNDNPVIIPGATGNNDEDAKDDPVWRPISPTYLPVDDPVWEPSSPPYIPSSPDDESDDSIVFEDHPWDPLSIDRDKQALIDYAIKKDKFKKLPSGDRQDFWVRQDIWEFLQEKLYYKLKDIALKNNITDTAGINKFLETFREKELKIKKRYIKKIIGEL